MSLEKTKMYSCMSLKVGLDAESQLPHAVEGLALEALFQMISPRIKKPKSTMSFTIKACRGM